MHVFQNVNYENITIFLFFRERNDDPLMILKNEVDELKIKLRETENAMNPSNGNSNAEKLLNESLYHEIFQRITKIRNEIEKLTEQSGIVGPETEKQIEQIVKNVKELKKQIGKLF